MASMNDTFVFYRTRPDKHGDTETLAVSGWMLIYASIFGWLAFFIWAIIACVYGIYFATNGIINFVNWFI